jgi:ribonuclease-3
MDTRIEPEAAPDRLEERLGYRFSDRGLLVRALTHASYANEHPPEADNERLAWVGDAVLTLVASERLHAAHPDETIGSLTSRRSGVVAGPPLARWAARLGLGPLLRLGRGERLSGGGEKESVLATAVEAILGAVYLEGGLPAARAVVDRLSVW